MIVPSQLLQEERAFELSPTPARVSQVSFNQNGKLMVAGSADGMIRLFDVGSRQAIMGWPAHHPVSSVLFSSDENSILSCGSDGCINMWSLHHMAKSLAKIGIPTDPTMGTSAEPLLMSMAGGCDTEYIMAVSNHSCDGYVFKASQLWQGTLQCIFKHKSPLLALDWQPTLNVCAAMGTDGTLCAAKITKRLE